MNRSSLLEPERLFGSVLEDTPPFDPAGTDGALADVLELGIPELDSDHRFMIAHYQALRRILDDGHCCKVFALRFRALIFVARQHFQREESLMLRVGYDGYALHEAAHKKLVRDGEDLILNVMYVFSSDDCLAVARFFKHWITHHIVTHDKKLAHFLLNSREISAASTN